MTPARRDHRHRPGDRARRDARGRRWRRMVAGRVRHRPGHACSTPRAIAAASPPKSRWTTIDAALTPLERRRWSRSDRIGVARGAPRRSPMPGCSTAASIGRGSACCLGAGTGDLLRNERLLPHLDDARARRARARPTSGIISPARRSTPSPSEFGFEGPRACVVAACSSSTIAIGRAADAIRRGRADAALAGGTDALARLTFSGFNALRLMDPEPCRPFDRSRAGMNIGEGAGILVLEELERARRARRAHLRRAGGLQPRRARRSIRRRRSPRAGRSRRSSRRRCADAARSMPTKSITSTRTAPRRRRTIAAEARGLRDACSATAPRAFRSRRSSR